MNTDTKKDFAHGDLTGRVLQAAFEVSNQLGCGFLENVYENALLAELSSRGMQVSRQVPIRVIYKNHTVGEYRADLIVQRQVLVEVKATIEHHKLYVAQTLNYLRSTGLSVGVIVELRPSQANVSTIGVVGPGDGRGVSGRADVRHPENLRVYLRSSLLFFKEHPWRCSERRSRR